MVGIAQLEQRIEDPIEAKEPIDLMLQALNEAARDASGGDGGELLKQATSVRVIKGFWPYKDPARYIAQIMGCASAQTLLTPYGGNFVQTVVNQTALNIQSGEHEIVLLSGAECGYSQARARKHGLTYEEMKWQQLEGKPDGFIGKEKPMSHDAELAAGIRMPIQYYPIFENALRHAQGETIEAHQIKVSKLWSRFSRVALDNPHAWMRDYYDPETIRTPTPENRPVSFPYPKLMNSNNNVDQAAALIMCSESAATRLGISRDKWVYPLSGTDAEDHYYVSHRDNLYSSPAIRLAGKRCLELAATDITELDLIDLYSCFPVAVEVAAGELGLDLERPLTVTGGLTFGGGPLNNYVMHSIARMTELLRENPHQKGLITANGGYLTKHAFGIYSAQRPAQHFRHQDLQAEVKQTPRRQVALDYSGKIEVEAYTVMYGPDGPRMAHIACRLPDGRRAWGNLQDAGEMEQMLETEACGLPGRLDAGTVKLA